MFRDVPWIRVASFPSNLRNFTRWERLTGYDWIFCRKFSFIINAVSHDKTHTQQMMYDTPYHTVIVIKLSTLYPTRSALIIATTCPLALGYRSDPVSAAGKSPRSKAMPLNPLINGHQDAPTAFTTFLLPVGGKIHLILRNIFQSDFLQRWHGTDLPNRTINSFAVCKAIRDILGI